LFFSKISNEKIIVHLMGWRVLWAGKYGNPSDRTLALGLTQPLVKMSTRNISCG